MTIASLGIATLFLTGAAAGSPLGDGPQLQPPDCVEIPMVQECETPTPTPTGSPTEEPTDEPTDEPTATESATEEPTGEPSESESATEEPSASACPSESGSEEPTEEPTEDPSGTPSGSTDPDPNPIDSILSLLPVAPIPGVSTTASEAPTDEPTDDPSETESPTEDPAGCEIPAAKTVITYAATTRVRYADLYTFSAKVTQARGLPVPAGQVSFMLPGFTYRAPVGTDGYARLRTRIASAPGNYRMNLAYTPAEGFQESRQQVGFIVVRTSTTCELYRQVTSTQSRLTGALRYPDRSRVPGAGVVFWYNGRPVANRVTNSIGVATLDTTRGRSGDTFSFTYPGDNKRTGCGTTIRVP